MTRLLRTRTVLRDSLATVLSRPGLPDRSVVQFRRAVESDHPGHLDLTLDGETLASLGDPGEVTVTIEPGDLMNAIPDAYLDVYRREDGRYDWRLTHRNGDILCGSNQGYENRVDAVRIADAVLGIREGYGIGFAAADNETGSLVRDPQAK